MQRQFSEQHTAEQKVSRQLEESGRQLSEMGSRVKGHAANIKGRRISLTTVHDGEQEQVSLPVIAQAPERVQFQ
jgi:predicted transcriptional regulator with HTH domain